VHWPLDVAPLAAEQAWQFPAHAELQQKPSTQLPPTHIVSRPHTPPTAICGAHFGVLCVMSQKPAGQSVSVVHELAHAVPFALQAKGLQLWDGGTEPQVPEALHCAGGWYVVPLHDAVEQYVPAGWGVLHTPDLHRS
jgi:hypothetical protein